MRSSVTVAVFAGLGLSLLCGCGRAPVPGQNAGTVTTFSLGSAHFTPFTTRPTARQLYDTAVHLYDSFHSVALSRESTSLGVFDPYGKGDWTVPTTARDKVEYRLVQPDKFVQVTVIQGRKGVAVANGKQSLFYRPWNNTYKRTRFLPEQVWQHMGLLRGHLTDVELLPDTRMGGAEVYALRMRAEQAIPKMGGTFKYANTLYLGKSDLLPRKLVEIYERPPADN